jgi:cell cycle checkpoint control protein RAD9A
VSQLAISAPAVKDILEPFNSGYGSDPLLVWNFGKDEVHICSWDGGVNKGAADGGRITQMATELRITTQEFDRYEMCSDVCGISFHLKEFNAGGSTIYAG